MLARIILLFGGSSTERRVSVASARNVLSAASSAVPLFIAPSGAVHPASPAELLAFDRPFENDFAPVAPALFPAVQAALDAASAEDVFLLALHGGEGENGELQRALEARGLAFTGSGSAASAAAFDKVRAKEIVARAGVRVAASRVVMGEEPRVREALDALFAEHGRLVVKPVADGSSFGLHHLRERGQVEGVAAAVARAGVPYLAERFLVGTELTVGVIDEGEGQVALPPSEVRIDPGRAFDFDGKYLGRGTLEVTPAEVPPAVFEAAQQTALLAHRALGCEGYTRTDLIAGDDGVTFLETNTLPGLTAASFIPQQLAASGRDMREFVAAQLRLAVRRRDRARHAAG